MRKLITAAFVSLDGVMQAPGGPQEDPTGGFQFGGWVEPHVDDVFNETIGTLFGQPYDLLLGRKTYEIFAAFWPYQDKDGPEGFIARSFDDVTKYVATRDRTPLSWKNSVALHDAAADVAKLKQQDGPALVTQGSTNLIHTLLAHDLIDELTLITFPIVLGKGKRLFDEGSKPAMFALTDHKVSSKGVVITSHKRAGAVPLGDMTRDAPPPSAAELKRRERWAREG